MLNRFSFFILGVAFISSLQFVHATDAEDSLHSVVNADQGDEIYSKYGGSREHDEDWVNPETVQLTGQVKFEPRYTRVISDQCGNNPCHQSQVYWTLVIEASGSKYLLNRKLSVGLKRAPEAMQVAGVNIRPGLTIQIEAHAVRYAPELFVLLDVQKVSLLPDLGWACHTLQDSSPHLYAQVWSQSLGGRDGDYKIKIQRLEDLVNYPVAYVDHADFMTQSNELVFGVQVQIKKLRYI